MNENNPAANDDTRALLDYYRNRASDLEYEFLQYQLAARKEIERLSALVSSAEVDAPSGVEPGESD